MLMWPSRALGGAGAAVAPHTGAAVCAQCCWSCCARSVMLELLWRPIPELLSALDAVGTAVRAQ